MRDLRCARALRPSVTSRQRGSGSRCPQHAHERHNGKPRGTTGEMIRAAPLCQRPTARMAERRKKRTNAETRHHVRTYVRACVRAQEEGNGCNQDGKVSRIHHSADGNSGLHDVYARMRHLNVEERPTATPTQTRRLPV